jgi:hypothetical protein
MRQTILLGGMLAALLVLPAVVSAQGFGEYGRAVGSIPHGPGITGGGKSGGGAGQGSVSSGGIGETGGHGLPVRLIVAKSTGLYPRQDGEAEKLAQLSEGETLVPMVQAAGGSDWFMVKTQKGLVGWVMGIDVRAEKK